MLTRLALCFIHFLYGPYVIIAAWLPRRDKRLPKPLKTQRNKIPKHLCLNLVADDDMPVGEMENMFLQCLQNVASWCRVLDIETLTVYDRHGILYGCSENAYRSVFVTKETSEDNCWSEVEYPLTPPLSEPSGYSSRSHSSERTTHPVDLNVITMTEVSGFRKCRNIAVRKNKDTRTPDNLKLHILSRASGKPAIVLASRSLLQACVSDATMSGNSVPRRLPYDLTVTQLAIILEAALPPPDLMVIHHVGGTNIPCPPIEFHGFPPWQNSLTEFHRTRPEDGSTSFPSCSETSGTAGVISEAAFCRILDEYAGAEFRLGK